MRSIGRRGRGQATVEFALMIPVMMSIFFVIMEANVFFTSLHMTAYASYASARAWEVCDPNEMHLPGGGFQQQCTTWVDNETKTPLLTGRLYPAGANASPGNLLTPDKLTHSSYSGIDGVTVAVTDYAMMPYSRLLLGYCPMDSAGNLISADKHCDAQPFVPTHLGPSGFDPAIYSDVRDQDGTGDGETDNNQQDSNPTQGGQVGNGQNGNGHGHGNGNGGHGNGNGNGGHGNGNGGHGNGFGNGRGNHGG